MGVVKRSGKLVKCEYSIIVYYTRTWRVHVIQFDTMFWKNIGELKKSERQIVEPYGIVYFPPTHFVLCKNVFTMK